MQYEKAGLIEERNIIVGRVFRGELKTNLGVRSSSSGSFKYSNLPLYYLVCIYKRKSGKLQHTMKYYDEMICSCFEIIFREAELVKRGDINKLLDSIESTFPLLSPMIRYRGVRRNFERVFPSWEKIGALFVDEDGFYHIDRNSKSFWNRWDEVHSSIEK
jgi:hypothetical protein